MENIISRIIELNRKADKTIQDARVRREEIICEAGAKADEIRKTSIERSKDNIRRVEEVEQKAANAEIEKYEKKREEKAAAYKKLYDDNHEKWEDEIFSDIIG